ncbi:MAG: ParA family protein [Verrucomicrobiae bacterium]|nr:ParA family protein [Verrucomicrobiae bacterium]
MSYVIAVVNNKGGTGKTTSTINLGHALANQKKKILLIDVDSQCNTTSTLLDGVVIQKSLYDILEGEAQAEEAIYPTEYFNLYVMPNIPETAALEPKILTRDDRGYSLLRDHLRKYVISKFDITLLDCPPNLGIFSIAAMICADSVIVPVEAGSRYATDGLEKTVELIEAIRENFTPELRFLRLLINKADQRTTVSRVGIETLKEAFGPKVFTTVISLNTDVQQSELVKKTVLRHNPKATASRQFRTLAKELLDIIEP